LREETRFESADELKLQLERDKMRFMNRVSEKVLAE
jgi:FAD synthase